MHPASQARRARRRKLGIESLEDRRLLAAVHMPLDPLAGTPDAILPIDGRPLVDAGTADSIRGLNNLVGDFLGTAPDAGAYEQGMGTPWSGPRNFGNLLAYGIPDGWNVAPLSRLSEFQNLGAPGAVDSNRFRLLLVQESPQDRAFLLVTFEERSGESRWQRFSEIIGGAAGDTLLVRPVQFRDGLAASLALRGSVVNLLGARVDDEGVLSVLGGVADAQLADVQHEMFSFVRSLYYAWNLQDRSVPISVAFTAPPVYGVVPVGTPGGAATGNATDPGVLGGDVTLTAASLLWEIAGDANQNATAQLEFRRQGTTAWRPALDLARVNYDDGTTRVNRLAGSIFGLAPGTVYEVRATLSDPDGGSETLVTTLTTRTVPKMLSGGTVVDVFPHQDLNALAAIARPGDTLLLHAGDYASGPTGGSLRISASGTAQRPILFRAYGDGAVHLPPINVAADNVWLDELHVTQTDSSRHALTSSSGRPVGVVVTRSTLRNGWHQIDAQGNDYFLADNTLTGAGQNLSKEGIQFHHDGRGHVAAFNDISQVSDGISYGHGNIDVHNNRIHHVYDDFIEPDYAWDNYRIWENFGWAGGPSGISFQPMKGGPWYVMRNQITGTTYNPFKLRTGSGPKYIVGNTIVSVRATQGLEQLMQTGGVYANNFWAMKVPSGNNQVGYSDLPFANNLRLWDSNRYEADDYRLVKFADNKSLAMLQSLGVESRSAMVQTAASPEIRVFERAVDLLHGRAEVDFGIRGEQPQTKQFVVRNVGTAPLTLQPVTVPRGFRVVENFAANTIVVPGGRASFSIQFDAASGSVSGLVELANNDADESNFNFLVRGNGSDPAQIIDDGDAGYSETGTKWDGSFSTSLPVYANDTRWHAAGTGSNTANWLLTGILPGEYLIQATWMPKSNRATNAPFTIFDGATVETTARINQQLEPAGPVFGGRPFQSLGTFNIDGTSIRVSLSDDANGFVLADAVRFERLGDVKPALQVQIAADQVSENGGTSTATVTRTLSTSGELIVSLTSSDTSEATVPATVTIPDGQASVSFVVTAVDDLLADGTQQVTITATATGFKSGSDTIDILDDEVATEFIVDDGDAGYSETGIRWDGSFSTTLPVYANDTRWHAAGTGTNTANWQIGGITPGSYEIQVTWMPKSNRATNAPFTVYDGTNLERTIRLNQQLEPSGPVFGGRPFQSLGTFNIDSTSMRVMLSDDANGYVLADAVRFVRLGNSQAALTVHIAADSISENGGTSTATVTRSTNTGGIRVVLSSSDTSEATVPVSVLIPDGQTSASFTVSAVDDNLADGTQTVIITASSPGYLSGDDSIDVLDNEVPREFIVDDGDPGYSETGIRWDGATASTLPVYANDTRWHAAGTGTNTANWQVSGLIPGEYEIQVTWMPKSNRATNAPFTVFDGATSEGTFRINQQLEPIGPVLGGRPFQSLGRFQIDGTSARVMLTDDANGYVLADAVRFVRVVNTVALVASYRDGPSEGFNDPVLGAQRKQAFEFALGLWSQYLVAAYDGETITVDAAMDPMGGSSTSATLASAGPVFVHANFGAGVANTWYGSALANHLAGGDLLSNPEIRITFNSDVDNSTVLGNTNWYYGLNGQPGGHIDLVTVAMHEVGHGLNFFDLIETDGSWSLSNMPSIYDRFLESSGGIRLTTMTAAERAAQLISNNLYWGGALGSAGNAGNRPRLYAPNPFRPGSSVAHLDEGVHGAEMMSPFYSGADHQPSAMELGILADMGWNTQG
jgi:hypothetical protein